MQKSSTIVLHFELFKKQKPLIFQGLICIERYSEWDLNPHEPHGSQDFKS